MKTVTTASADRRRCDETRTRAGVVAAVASALPVWLPVVPLPGRRDVIRVPEADYAYGLGVLTLRVTHVDPDPHPNLEWLRVAGTEIRWDGTDGRQRDVLIRVSALRRHPPRKP